MHHASATELWFKQYKVASGRTTLAYDAACEEAVCFGWVDGIVHPCDATAFLRRFTPRRDRSNWCASNRRRLAKMQEAGLMHASGIERYETALANGSWERSVRLEEQLSEMPAELESALLADPSAHRFFHSLSASNRRGYLHWIHSAKRPETRRQRIDQTVQCAQRGQASRTAR